MNRRADSRTGAEAWVVVLLLCFSIPQLISCAVSTGSLADVNGTPYPENNPPHDLDFTYEPSDPDNGLLVYLNATAIDDEGDSLTYEWCFGDGEVSSEPRVTHQFRNAGDNNITLLVDDGATGSDPRPVSLTKTLSVSENNLPSLNIFPDRTVNYHSAFSYWARFTELDVRDRVRLTWIWGDGSITVTEDWSTGGQVEVWTDYTYSRAGVYNVTVWADDLTGLPGHNVSDYALVLCRGGLFRPLFISFTVNNSCPTSGEAVKFTAEVTDADHDDIELIFYFGDGTSFELFIPWNSPDSYAVYTYAEPGLKVAYATASDGWLLGTSPIVSLNVSRAGMNISFVSGWNLVSVPLVDWGGNASALGLGRGDMVIGWNSSSRRYDNNYIVGMSPPSFDFAISGSEGIWIFAQSAKTLQINGTVANSVQTREIIVPPGGGWVMIGFNSLNTTRHASNVPAMYSGGSITAVARYASPGYVILIIGGPVPMDFVLTPGEGYWCYCTASGTLSYSP